jgi:hypothetical protein
LGIGLFSSASDRQRSIIEKLYGISFGYVDQAEAPMTWWSVVFRFRGESR